MGETRSPTIKLEKAHDVRHLRDCTKCGAIGDRRYMPIVGGKLHHGFCAVEVLGVSGVAALPKTEVGKITLGEIGPHTMRAICDLIGATP